METEQAGRIRHWGPVVAWLFLLFLPLALQAQTVTWQENWELPSAQNDWYADNGVWEIGVPTYGPPLRTDSWRAHQGTNCAATVLNGNYPIGKTSRLISPEFEVPAASLNPRLRFWHWWSFSGGDYGKVQVSTNDGTTWTDLSPQYTDSSGNWTYSPPFSLSSYGGKSVKIGFYFASPGGGASSGWYVDDMVLLADGYPPMITAQPTNLTVVIGNAACFSVAVNPLSTPPVSYQWRFKGAPIPDATNATYCIPSAQTNDAL